MTKPQKPLMLAYIIFLFIALIYHAIAKVFNLNFSAWESIIVAATIASYAFALSSLSKSTLKQYQKYHKLLNKYLPLTKQLRQKEKTLLEEGEKKEKLLEHGKTIIKDTTELISTTGNKIRKFEKIAFILDVAGYLLFFCVICFDGAYEFFSTTQDSLTLFAFALLLFIDYWEGIISKRFESTFDVLIKNTEDTIKNLEEKHNGKTENAQS